MGSTRKLARLISVEDGETMRVSKKNETLPVFQAAPPMDPLFLKVVQAVSVHFEWDEGITEQFKSLAVKYTTQLKRQLTRLQAARLERNKKKIVKTDSHNRHAKKARALQLLAIFVEELDGAIQEATGLQDRRRLGGPTLEARLVERFKATLPDGVHFPRSLIFATFLDTLDTCETETETEEDRGNNYSKAEAPVSVRASHIKDALRHELNDHLCAIWSRINDILGGSEQAKLFQERFISLSRLRTLRQVHRNSPYYKAKGAAHQALLERIQPAACSHISRVGWQEKEEEEEEEDVACVSIAWLLSMSSCLGMTCSTSSDELL